MSARAWRQTRTASHGATPSRAGSVAASARAASRAVARQRPPLPGRRRSPTRRPGALKATAARAAAIMLKVPLMIMVLHRVNTTSFSGRSRGPSAPIRRSVQTQRRIRLGAMLQLTMCHRATPRLRAPLPTTAMAVTIRRTFSLNARRTALAAAHTNLLPGGTLQIVFLPLLVKGRHGDAGRSGGFSPIESTP